MMITYPTPNRWWLCTLHPPDDDDAADALDDVVPGLKEADEDLLAAIKYQDVSEE